MKTKLSYNMHEAINLRGQTIDQAGFFDIYYMHPDQRDELITFRTSIEMTGGDFEWGNIPLHVDVLMGLEIYDLVKLRMITREKWRKEYRSWRIYRHQSGDPREEHVLQTCTQKKFL